MIQNNKKNQWRFNDLMNATEWGSSRKRLQLERI